MSTVGTAPQPDVDFNLLTKTSAMSCMSWSLPAGPGVCGGFTLAKNSVCAMCYAGGGRYNMPNVKDPQVKRLAWWRQTEDSAKVDTLVAAISKLRVKYFRCFDCGDFSTPADVKCWRDIIARCPDIKFWVPTRTWRLEAFRKELIELAKLPNVVVRRSALVIDEGAPVDTELRNTSEVRSTGMGCPKQTAGSCAAANCRKCWDKSVDGVSYLLHGHKVNWAAKAQKK